MVHWDKKTATESESNLSGEFPSIRAGVVCRVKAKFSLYSPGQALQEVEAPRSSRQRHMKVARLSAVRTGRLYPQEIFLVVISVRG
jgi:hypothetical protein